MEKKKGRQVGSDIRDNLVELLYFLGSSYGYDLYKKYLKVFGRVSRRSVYYHLRKGVDLGIFKIERVEDVKGDYSWGAGVRRIVYALGPAATPRASIRVKEKLSV